jgi:flagellar biosynthesis/type III secretory pathway protein FliH
MKTGQYLFLALNKDATLSDWDSLNEADKKKFHEIEAEIERRGHEQGYEAGRDDGYDEGYDEGRSDYCDEDNDGF